MGWVVRFSAGGLTDLALELLVSELWDLGSTGISSEDGGAVIAGFPSQGRAETAASVVGRTLDRLDRTGSTAAPALTSASASGRITVEPAAPIPDWQDDELHTVSVAGAHRRLDLTIRTGPSFGHGSHPTTRLILQQLADLVNVEGDVLDVGTGSGVLALAAAKAGASAVAIDHDAAAVAMAEENAARNDLSIDCRHATIGQVMADRSQPFGLVLVNVLLPGHRRLAPEIVGALSTGGSVITAGYLHAQIDELHTLYEPLRPVALSSDGDWSSHRFQHTG